jgi:hypothetical protein
MARSQVHVIRRGAIKATISGRRSRSGLRMKLRISRLIPDGDRYQESSRFTVSDLPLVRLVLDESYSWMLQQRAAGSPRGEKP